MSKFLDALNRAISAAGSKKALADLIGVHPSMVTQYLRETKDVPLERSIDIEMAVGGKARAEELCSKHAARIAYLRNSARA